MDKSMEYLELEKKFITQRERKEAKYSCVYLWLELMEEGENLIPFFKDHRCETIAIYGAAEIGRLLLMEIQNEHSIRVSYFLDKNADKQRERWGITVYHPQEFMSLPAVDMVVVTAIFSFESINNTLLQIRPEIPVVSLNTIVEARRNEVWCEQQ